MDLAGRMDDKAAGLDRDGLLWRAHGAAALEAEIDFGRVRVAMIGADLARFPAGDRDVAVLDLAEDFLDMSLRIPFGLVPQAENKHSRRSPRQIERSGSPARFL